MCWTETSLTPGVCHGWWLKRAGGERVWARIVVRLNSELSQGYLYLVAA